MKYSVQTFGIFFGISIIFIFVFFSVKIRSEASLVATNVSILNSSPSVQELHINTVNASSFSDATIILPSPGGTRNVFLNGLVSDMNGDVDIVNVQATFSRSGAGICSLTGDQDDKNFCYRNVDCVVGGQNNDDVASFSCTIPIWYFVDATTNTTQNWVGQVVATDESGESSVMTQNVEMGEVISMSPASLISFGTLSNGESTNAANNGEMSVTQTGNSALDVNVSGTAMFCTYGNIPVQNIRYTLTDTTGGIALTSAFETFTSFNLMQRTDDVVDLSKMLYWNLSIPSGVSGTCSGSVSVTAVSDS